MKTKKFKDTEAIIKEELPLLWKTQPFVFILAIPAMLIVIPYCFICELFGWTGEL